MNIKSLFCSFLLINSFPMLAHAVIIEGTFTGSVTQAQSLGDDSGSLLWSDDIVGKAIAGNFWYDTDLTPVNGSNRENEAIYFSRNNWIGLVFNIDGKTVDISRGRHKTLEVTERVDVLTLANHVPAVNGDSNENMMIYDSTFFGDPNAEFKETSGFVSFNESIVNVLNGIGSVQEFDWFNQSDPATSFGNAYFATSSLLQGQYAYADATMDISEIHASIRDASVPEPSSLALLSIAMLTLVGRSKIHTSLG
ncbi:MAG: PEP-CTERM sorting domain-containing protein [Pseudomonadota bacterium]